VSVNLQSGTSLQSDISHPDDVRSSTGKDMHVSAFRCYGTIYSTIFYDLFHGAET